MTPAIDRRIRIAWIARRSIARRTIKFEFVINLQIAPFELPLLGVDRSTSGSIELVTPCEFPALARGHRRQQRTCQQWHKDMDKLPQRRTKVGPTHVHKDLRWFIRNSSMTASALL